MRKFLSIGAFVAVVAFIGYVGVEPAWAVADTALTGAADGIVAYLNDNKVVLGTIGAAVLALSGFFVIYGRMKRAAR